MSQMIDLQAYAPLGRKETSACFEAYRPRIYERRR